MINRLRKIQETRKENGQRGFSLIELIVVVVILGVLVAIAIPVYGGIQENAEKNAVATSAANAATSVAVAIANDDTVDAALFTSLSNDKTTVDACTGGTFNTNTENVCVTASAGKWIATAGTAPEANAEVTAVP